MKTYIGIDNGTTGSIGIITPNSYEFIPTPIVKVQDYTKAKKTISRLNYATFKAILEPYKGENVMVILERAMVNPARFQASCTALRCFEAQLVAIEDLGLPYMFLDSKEWQKKLLPSGCSGDELKKASKDIGDRLFPMCKDAKHPDRDGILIAEYGKRENF